MLRMRFLAQSTSRQIRVLFNILVLFSTLISSDSLANLLVAINAPTAGYLLNLLIKSLVSSNLLISTNPKVIKIPRLINFIIWHYLFLYNQRKIKNSCKKYI